MTSASATFQERHLFSTPIRALKLQIEGTPLEPVLAEFLQETARAGADAEQLQYAGDADGAQLVVAERLHQVKDRLRFTPGNAVEQLPQIAMHAKDRWGVAARCECIDHLSHQDIDVAAASRGG